MHITSSKNDDGRTQTEKETEKHVHLLCLDRINQRLGAIEKIRRWDIANVDVDARKILGEGRGGNE